ncbi:MAG: DUF63 family protein [Candidatus Micrarchaeia archaeon]|jgi:uncharacterized membrane protein
MAGFVEDYFLNPVWDRTGYNMVNTLVYAGIALAAAYLIYRLLKREKIAIDARFILSIIPFILFGSTARVITDSVDTGAMALHAGSPIADFVLNAHFYDYNYFTVTPGIYVVVGLLTIVAVFGLNRLKKPELIAPLGIVLWLSQLALLSPVLTYWYFTILALVLAIAATGLGYFALLKMKAQSLPGALVVFAHALDGAATFTIIDIFGPAVGKPYFEQHVLSRAIGFIGDSMLSFFAVKVIFATAAVLIVQREASDEQEKMFILLLLLIFGLAPGARDLLRMLAGA